MYIVPSVCILPPGLQSTLYPQSVFYTMVCSLHCTLSLYFTPRSAVYIVPSACILPPGLQSALYPQSVFYPLVCSLHCTLSLYFTPWSAVYIVPSVCILPNGLQSTLYPQSVFYPLVCSLHCTLSLYFTPWSAVHIVPSVCILHPGLQSTLYPQSAFYSRFAICVLNWPVLHRLNAGHSEIFIEFPPRGFFKLLENKCRVVLCKRRNRFSWSNSVLLILVSIPKIPPTGFRFPHKGMENI